MKKLLIIMLIFKSTFIFSQDATEIIKKADKKLRGISSESEMTMKIIRPTWERSVTFKSWSKGLDFSLTLITSPANEKGQTFLKRYNEMWSWNPVISRMIKLPPSMLSQGWMGSDYSNDDILKESSIVVDYTHKLLGEETIDGRVCYKIELTPKEDAAVVWGKIIKWITKESYLQLKSEFFDEDNYLVKTEKASKIKKMDDREIPTYIEILPADKPNHKTVLIINSIKFDIEISEQFFSQQNMKRVR